ncbi:hypothetical protein [Paenarthrobacter ureafaciens]|uniref:hypothetical protein n=1 Tax=Paenarthrobacter ureafaciens TaxID=37931 RepID=UPI0009ACADCE|nr:hypothetical protein [Paenarthrobacter ureafaciens]GLU58594.1 hypothetical protein Pure01_11070 [Paenarthrobacter ureafaciens]GLU61839.1 hypothetical protein Pure02_00890 [Paenarthrobacter ureafaciens]GLU66113.1 hypothetical protein Pure03_00890 [Paenarthrobacter ureafaciens]GLU71563.1 hypothetical protein Pure04_12780 [Paenarthrobacter ureafaciens]GLU74650.1 hypothetical protein Pure05_00900 [Paenarthrobacter ureafaciens]
MSARVEAASKALCSSPDLWARLPERFRQDYREVAAPALDAADAVLFSEAAIERAAKAMFRAQTFNDWGTLDPKIKTIWISKARAVVAALREEA